MISSAGIFKQSWRLGIELKLGCGTGPPNFCTFLKSAQNSASFDTLYAQKVLKIVGYSTVLHILAHIFLFFNARVKISVLGQLYFSSEHGSSKNFVTIYSGYPVPYVFF